MDDKFENLNDIEKAESWLGEARGPDTALVYAMIANAKAAERQAAALERIAEVLEGYAAGENVINVDLGA